MDEALKRDSRDEVRGADAEPCELESFRNLEVFELFARFHQGHHCEC